MTPDVVLARCALGLWNGGLVGIMDPLRSEAAEAVRAAPGGRGRCA
jgi:hypothetical protein